MFHRVRRLRTILVGLGLLVAAACGGGNSHPTSTLNLGLTDASIDGAQKVWITFTGVEVKPANGNAMDFNFATSKGLDLLTLANGATATFLNGQTVPAGEYEWVRLMIDTSAGANYVIDSTGAQHNLTIPSGAETGLKLIQGFTMPQGGIANFTVDFVLSKSVIAPTGLSPDYLLKPVLRLVDNAQVGTISGTFQAAALAAPAQPNCSTHPPVVYVYPGANVTPDDIFIGGIDAATTPPEVEPLVTATATLNASSVYAYSIPFLTAGTYTVAFTCDVDDPNVDESATATPLHFTTAPQPAIVSAGMTTTVDF